MPVRVLISLPHITYYHRHEDDCSGHVPDNRIGLAGIILVAKIARAAAAEDFSLDDVIEEVDYASKNVFSLNVKIPVGACKMTNFLDVVSPGSGDMDHDQHQVMDQNQPINDILTTTFQHIISKDYCGVSFSGGSRVICFGQWIRFNSFD